MITSRRAHGFTLIEVVIGMALFSLFLIATIGSFGALSKIYQHGVATRRATDNSRLLLEDVIRTVRFASSVQVDSSNFRNAFPVYTNSTSHYSCGPDLDVYTASSTSTPAYIYALTSTTPGVVGSPSSTPAGDYSTAAWAMGFTNNNITSNNYSQVTQNDGTTIDISQSNANGVTNTYTNPSDGKSYSGPGAYIFCVYTDPNNAANSYVKISFTINNNAAIQTQAQNTNQPFLLFNVDSTGLNAQGVTFTTTVGIGGAQP